MSDSGPDPERLRALGERLDEVQKRRTPPPDRRATSVTPAGIALRLSTELAAGLLVGIGFGWGIDWLFGFFGIHTRPIFIVVFFLLGAIAGIRNVVHAAREINAQVAASTSAAPAVDDDDEE